MTPPVSLFAGLAVAPLFLVLALALIALNWRWISIRGTSPLALILAAIGIWGLVSTLWTPASPLQGMETGLGSLVLAALALAALATVKDLAAPDRHRVGIALAVGVALSSALLLFESQSSYAIARAITIWRHGVEPNQHMLQAMESRGAVVLLLLLWPALAAPIHPIGRTLLFGLAVSALLSEGKHASVVALCAGCVVAGLVWLAPRWGLNILRSGAVILVLAMPAIDYMLPSNAELEQGTLINSARHRVVIWRFTIDRWVEHPIWGWGIDASRVIPGGNESTVIVVGTQNLHYQNLPLHPHNGPLQMWLELGLPGALLLAALLWTATTSLLVSRRSHPAMVLGAAIIACALTVGTMSFGIWQGWWQSALWLATLAFAASPLGALRDTDHA
jgi:O-antigen ligase